MTVSTTIGSIIIEDNIFDYGNFTADGQAATSPTTYGYTNCIITNSDAVITNNYLAGISGSGTHIVVNSTGSFGGTQTITENVFVRGTSSISAYIDVSATSFDAVIVDNEFDSPTIDGTSETLVILPAPGVSSPIVTYERNKNQTGILQIQKSPYLLSKQTTPCINKADRFDYVDNTNQNWINATQPDGGGYYRTNFTAGFFQQEGVAINYVTPFSTESAVKFTGNFDLTNGSPTVGVYPFGPFPYGGPSGSVNLSGFIVFGNDNTYYTISSGVIGGASGNITSLTLTSNYTGPSRQAVDAIYYPVSGSSFYNSLSYNFLSFTTFTGTSGNNFVTVASGTISGVVVVGSSISFQSDTTGNIYKVTGISGSGGTGTTINISPLLGANITGSNGSAGATVATLNFSINLSELLPSNVRVVSTVFGVFGNGGSNNTTLIANAGWTANMMTDYGGKYSTVLQGTFHVSNTSTTVTTSVSQVGILVVGSGICFDNQPDYVYTVTSVAPTVITLSIPYFGPTNTATTATYFDNSLADARNYVITGEAVGPFGSNIGFFVGNGNLSTSDFGNYTQYLKIDPEASGFSAFTGSGRLLRYNLSIFFTVATPCNLFFPESPLIVKYRW